MIDYERLARNLVHGARLTRATRSGDPAKVLEACKLAVTEWDAIGCWPDDWSRWQRALDDSRHWNDPLDLWDV